MDPPKAVILAAGKGTRMKSDLPKVLFPVLGRPMIHYVLDALTAAGVEKQIVVVGYEAQQVRDELKSRSELEFAMQSEQLGTGHAVQMARSALEGHRGPVIVLAGDSPLAQPKSLRSLLARFSTDRPGLLLGTLHAPQPKGLGRILRDSSGNFLGIVEEKDATEDQRRIHEVNMSTYIFDGPPLLEALSKLSADNSQGEYYLTDCARLLREAGHRVEAAPLLESCEGLSINTRDELTIVEQTMREMGYTGA
jgi:bifunctional UDP-N-acetylglucosamine pyrophosphorylase/glucosamine-1-phosphate N-acetyltransferase/UDP-N-acetylglucosamine pyrophosphorylase